jgi:hypothetical protein
MIVMMGCRSLFRLRLLATTLLVMVMVVIVVIVVRMTVVMIMCSMMVIVAGTALVARLAEPEFGCRHAGAQNAFRRDGIYVQRQTAEGLTQLADRQSDVEQRAEHHVPGHAGEAVEVRGFRHGQSVPFSRKLK